MTADGTRATDPHNSDIAAQAEAGCVRRIDPETGESALFASEAFRAGQVITPFRAASTSKEPAVWSVQVAEDDHIELWPPHLRYCNHSCDPNCYFDVDGFALLSLRDIAVGDELTFFYPSTEWDMHQPFNCHCGSAFCLGVISGAKATPPEVLARYRVSDFIERQLASTRLGLT